MNCDLTSDQRWYCYIIAIWSAKLKSINFKWGVLCTLILHYWDDFQFIKPRMLDAILPCQSYLRNCSTLNHQKNLWRRKGLNSTEWTKSLKSVYRIHIINTWKQFPIQLTEGSQIYYPHQLFIILSNQSKNLRCDHNSPTNHYSTI